MSGVEEWNKAFINLGYSNKTIRAITPDALDEWPNDYAIGDIRYNTISMLADPSITMAIGVLYWELGLGIGRPCCRSILLNRPICC